MAARPTSLIPPILFGVVGTFILVSLGFWQIQRLEQKETAIAAIQARMQADPLPLPEYPTPDAHALLRVALTGKLGVEELHVISSIKQIGPGFRVIVPMELGQGTTGSGRRVMVDLGFVPERLKDPESRRQGSVRWLERAYVDGVVGLLLWPNEIDSFTPEPDEGRGIWFARDVPQMAEALGTEPILVVAGQHPEGEWPRPRLPGVDLPNRHLEYALTWFGLALVWAVMTVLWVRSLRRAAKSG